jgi:hypothetical protein
MSNAPSKVSIDRLVQDVEKSSVTLAEQSTALSEIIKQVDARLSRMPGKTEVFVEEGDIRLSFEKCSREWGLWIIDADSIHIDNEPQPDFLTSVSVPRKARAFVLLPALLRLLDSEHNRQAREIAKAFKSLEEGE